jgi:signal transduction histidine kinase
MLASLRKYALLGTPKAGPELHRSILLTNYFALILFLLSLVFMLVVVMLVGIHPWVYRLALPLAVYPLIPLLQYFGYNIMARLLASCFVPVFIIWLLATWPQQAEIVYTPSYFVPRLIATSTCIIPILVFNTLNEKKWLFPALGICAFCVLGYDLLLPLTGREVAFFKEPQRMLYYNLAFAVQFFAITSAALIMKRFTDKAEYENFRLRKNLEQANRQLNDALTKQEALNEELRTQTEELRASQEKLQESHSIIEKQREELQHHNENLEKLVAVKSEELVQANAELAKSNSELRQFSYTLSHNLRAPVARIQGLANLLARTEVLMNDEQKEYLKLLRESTHELEHVIRDLNKIIDIRNEIYRLKEKVNLTEEVSRILLLLKEWIPTDAQIVTDFHQAPYVYAVRPMVHSILFNLISNAVKYRALNRPLHITLSSHIDDDCVLLKVTDNGLGINLEQFGKNLFGMYKRFHTHTEGRGLGLFLVKTQMELMGGAVMVDSQLNAGTCFTLKFQRPKNLEGQICLENASGTLFFHAPLKACGITWKPEITSENYRQLFVQALEILKLYHATVWISDLRNQGPVPAEDLNWMLSDMLPQAVQLGLTHIAVLYDPLRKSQEYINFLKQTIEKTGVTISFFTRHSDAEAWLELRTALGTIRQPD